MNRIPAIPWPCLSGTVDLAWACACASRMLLLLAAIEILTMPITQHIWTWDGFLHGGQDFEMGMLMVVTCLCLVLLKTQHNRQSIGSLLAMGVFLLLTFQRDQWSSLLQFGRALDPSRHPLPDLPALPQNLPLLI